MVGTKILSVKEASRLGIQSAIKSSYNCARFLCHNDNRSLVLFHTYRSNVVYTILECAHAVSSASGRKMHMKVLCDGVRSKKLWDLNNNIEKTGGGFEMSVSTFDEAIEDLTAGKGSGVNIMEDYQDIIVVTDWYAFEGMKDRKSRKLIYNALKSCAKVICVVLETVTHEGWSLLACVTKGMDIREVGRDAEYIPVSVIAWDDPTFLIPHYAVHVPEKNGSSFYHKSEDNNFVARVRVHTKKEMSDLLMKYIKSNKNRRIAVVCDSVQGMQAHIESIEERNKGFYKDKMALTGVKSKKQNFASFFVNKLSDSLYERKIRNEKFLESSNGYMFIERTTDSYIDNLQGTDVVMFMYDPDETTYVRTLRSMLHAVEPELNSKGEKVGTKKRSLDVFLSGYDYERSLDFDMNQSIRGLHKVYSDLRTDI